VLFPIVHLELTRVSIPQRDSDFSVPAISSLSLDGNEQGQEQEQEQEGERPISWSTTLLLVPEEIVRQWVSAGARLIDEMRHWYMHFAARFVEFWLLDFPPLPRERLIRAAHEQTLEELSSVVHSTVTAVHAMRAVDHRPDQETQESIEFAQRMLAHSIPELPAEYLGEKGKMRLLQALVSAACGDRNRFLPLLGAVRPPHPRDTDAVGSKEAESVVERLLALRSYALASVLHAIGDFFSHHLSSTIPAGEFQQIAANPSPEPAHFEAARLGHLAALHYLIDYGLCDPATARDSRDRSLLVLSILYDNRDLVAFLLNLAEVRARIDEPQGSSGNTPLCAAVATGNAPIAEMILDAGADPCARSSGQDSWSPLHAAVVGGFRDIVRLLLDAGADPDQESADGSTPVSLAREDTGMLEILQDEGESASTRVSSARSARSHRSAGSARSRMSGKTSTSGLSTQGSAGDLPFRGPPARPVSSMMVRPGSAMGGHLPSTFDIF
jgi:hypothetical protein